MNLNKNELFVSVILTSIVCIPTIGNYSIFIVPICSFFWAYAGAGHGRAYRWLLIPCLIAITAILRHGLTVWPMLLSIPTACIALSMGYGIPTLAPARPDHDEGSTLGRFFFNLFKGNEFLANVFTRGVIYAIFLLSYFIPYQFSYN